MATTRTLTRTTVAAATNKSNGSSKRDANIIYNYTLATLAKTTQDHTGN